MTTGVLVGVGVGVGATGVSVASGRSPPEVVLVTTGVGISADCVGVAVGVLGGANDSRGTVVAVPDNDSTVATAVESGCVVDDGVLDGVGPAVGGSVGTSVDVSSGVRSPLDRLEP